MKMLLRRSVEQWCLLGEKAVFDEKWVDKAVLYSVLANLGNCLYEDVTEYMGRKKQNLSLYLLAYPGKDSLESQAFWRNAAPWCLVSAETLRSCHFTATWCSDFHSGSDSDFSCRLCKSTWRRKKMVVTKGCVSADLVWNTGCDSFSYHSQYCIITAVRAALSLICALDQNLCGHFAPNYPEDRKKKIEQYHLKSSAELFGNLFFLDRSVNFWQVCQMVLQNLYFRRVAKLLSWTFPVCLSDLCLVLPVTEAALSEAQRRLMFQILIIYWVWLRLLW